jgi:hypothetical protein
MDPTSWQLAKDVISEALRRPVSERERFIRSRCPDAALADELVAMLHVDATAGLTEEPDTEPYDPGTRLGPYIVLDRLGRGGMGEVFLGNDPRLQRKVALKCVIRSLTGAGEARQRILHEARAAARVNHPNVATIHDIIEVEDRAFIVMEYVEGQSLAARLKRDRLSMTAVIDIGKQLASALAAAHAKGVVHRDLKPANVQLTPDGHAKVLDFGVANAPRLTLTNASASATTRTPAPTTVRVGQPGTPPYMSPEQLLGRLVDERSDIFSLGVVLFEMATGKRPFAGDDHLSMIVAQSPGAPRADAVNPQVPRTLADLIARAMALKADERFASAADVVSALVVIERSLERRTEPLSRKIARAVVGVVVVLATIELLGVIRTIGFNINFGRTGAFARFGAESWTEYFRLGLPGILPKLILMTAAWLLVLGVQFAIRMLTLIGPIARTTASLRSAWLRFVSTLELDEPGVLAQVIACAGIIAIVLFAWHQIDLVTAFASSFNSAPIAALMPMGESARARGYYQNEFTLLTFALGFSLYKVWQMRSRRGGSGNRWALAPLAAVVAVAALMNEIPYRSFNYRDFERADYAGSHCYINGESGTELLVLCPASEPPRNRAVQATDPQLRRLGVTENVFRGVVAPTSR